MSSTSTTGPFPRHECRGSIEAGPRRSGDPGCWRHFRGTSAAAPLKLLPDKARFFLQPLPFPRHECRGSIEASAARADRSPARRHFRGTRAAAPLKPGGPRSPVRPGHQTSAARVLQFHRRPRLAGRAHSAEHPWPASEKGRRELDVAEGRRAGATAPPARRGCRGARGQRASRRCRRAGPEVVCLAGRRRPRQLHQRCLRCASSVSSEYAHRGGDLGRPAASRASQAPIAFSNDRQLRRIEAERLEAGTEGARYELAIGSLEALASSNARSIGRAF